MNVFPRSFTQTSFTIAFIKLNSDCMFINKHVDRLKLHNSNKYICNVFVNGKLHKIDTSGSHHRRPFQVCGLPERFLEVYILR